MGAVYGEAMTWADGRHAGFEAANRNQRSITLDLKQEKGRDLLYKLVEQADVFFTNYTDGVAKRLQRRLRHAAHEEPEAGLRHVQHLRPRRALGRAARLRPDGAGPQRPDVRDGRARLPGAGADRLRRLPTRWARRCSARASSPRSSPASGRASGRRSTSRCSAAMLHLQSMGVSVTSFRGKSWAQHSRTQDAQPADEPLPLRRRQVDALLGDPGRPLLAGVLPRARPRRADRRPERFATAMGGRRENADELIDILDRTLATKTARRVGARFEEMKAPFAYSPVHDYDEVLRATRRCSPTTTSSSSTTRRRAA